MKKFSIILFTAVLVISLCACTAKTNDKDNRESSTSDADTTSDTTKERGSGAMTTTDPVADPVWAVEDLTTEKVVWGPGNITDHKQPNEPVSLQSRFADYDAKWLLDDEKSICLTFDEGYENGFTPAILDTLKEKKVRAVFFVTYDFASQNPELIKRMIDEGHVVGNHTYRHYTMDEQDIETATQEVTYLHDYIKENYDYTMRYFRFPKGEFSQQSLGIVKNLGYKSIFWSYAYADWDAENQISEAEAMQKICESTHPGEIMLLHAVSQTNANILGKVIDDVRQQGYKFTIKL